MYLKYLYFKQFTTLAITEQAVEFVTPHMVFGCPASLLHLANDRPAHYPFFTFWPRGLNPGPKFTKRRDDLPPNQVYHPTKFQPHCANGLQDMHYQSFSLFGPGGNAWAKVHQRGEDLLPIQVYDPAKFHRPELIHAGNIPYK